MTDVRRDTMTFSGIVCTALILGMVLWWVIQGNAYADRCRAASGYPVLGRMNLCVRREAIIPLDTLQTKGK